MSTYHPDVEAVISDVMARIGCDRREAIDRLLLAVAVATRSISATTDDET